MFGHDSIDCISYYANIIVHNEFTASPWPYSKKCK